MTIPAKTIQPVPRPRRGGASTTTEPPSSAARSCVAPLQRTVDLLRACGADAEHSRLNTTKPRPALGIARAPRCRDASIFHRATGAVKENGDERAVFQTRQRDLSCISRARRPPHGAHGMPARPTACWPKAKTPMTGNECARSPSRSRRSGASRSSGSRRTPSDHGATVAAPGPRRRRSSASYSRTAGPAYCSFNSVRRG